MASPFTEKTRLLSSFDGLRAHDGTRWRDYEAMAIRKLPGGVPGRQLHCDHLRR
jgi:hypothetical protein